MPMISILISSEIGRPDHAFVCLLGRYNVYGGDVDIQAVFSDLERFLRCFYHNVPITCVRYTEHIVFCADGVFNSWRRR